MYVNGRVYALVMCVCVSIRVIVIMYVTYIMNMDLLVLEEEGVVVAPTSLPNLCGGFRIYMYVEICKPGYRELVWFFSLKL